MLKKFLQNNEILKSLQDGVEEKVTSPIYGVFIISWLFFHWKFVYTAVFVSEEKIWVFSSGMLKNDYLSKTFFNFSDPWFYASWVLPIFFTWLFVWKFPKWISIPAFKKSQEYQAEKLEVKIETEARLPQKQLRMVELMEKKTVKEKEIKEKEKEIKEIDPTIEWLKEFNQVLLNEKDVQAIKEGSGAIYQTNGRFVSNPQEINRGYNTYISSSSLSRLDALDLIKILSERRNVMEFTEKGKFFVRELQKKNIL